MTLVAPRSVSLAGGAEHREEIAAHILRQGP
jgi:hypothetical protein